MEIKLEHVLLLLLFFFFLKMIMDKCGCKGLIEGMMPMMPLQPGTTTCQAWSRNNNCKPGTELNQSKSGYPLLIPPDRPQYICCKDKPVDCVGSWSPCSTSCLQSYSVTIPASHGGSCDNEGITRSCTGGSCSSPPPSPPPSPSPSPSPPPPPPPPPQPQQITVGMES